MSCLQEQTRQEERYGCHPITVHEEEENEGVVVCLGFLITRMQKADSSDACFDF